MSTELEPFAEVTAPEMASGRPTPVDPTLGRLVLVAEWLMPRRTAHGVLTRPRVVVLGAPSVDAETTALLAELNGVGFERVSVDDATPTDSDTAPADRDTAADADVPTADTAADTAAAADDVLTTAAAVAAIDAGRRLADREIDGGADLLVVGLAGSGHERALGVLTSVLTGLEPVAAVTVPDTDPTPWVAAVIELRDTLFRLRDRDKDVVSLVAAVAGPELGALAGLLAQAAVRRTPVLLDGLPATIAAVLAHRLAPGAEAWFLAAGQAPDRPGRRLQDMLGLPLVASLDTSSPSGAGAVLVLPLIQAALAVSARTAPPAPEPVSDDAGTSDTDVDLAEADATG